MLRVPLALVAALLCACRPSSHDAHLQRELQFLRAGVGVDLVEEERAVRRVLAQRHLTVVNQVRAPGLVALGAQTLDGRLSAVRILTRRGVVVAEDAALDDLFAPATVTLLEDVPSSLGEYTLVGLARVPKGHDQGCARLHRILPEGQTVEAVLDVGTLGSRACVAHLARGPGGRLFARVAFPQMAAGGLVPSLDAQLAFHDVLPGRATPLTPVARLVEAGDWLEAERSRVAQTLAPEAQFAERHGVGVARAAVALLSGLDVDRQLGVYREAIGRLRAGSAESEIAGDTLAHIERGWLDEVRPPEAVVGAPEEGVIIEPGPATGDEERGSAETEPAPADDPTPEDAIIVEPEGAP